MAQPTRLTCLVALVCIVYTSILSETRAGTMPSGVHSREPLDDGTLPQTRFDEFVRALADGDAIAPPSDDETPNDVFPLDSEHRTGEVASFQKRAGGRYCGPVLADVLELVCGKNFLSMFGKRSAPSDKAPGKQETWPFVNSNKALQVLSNQHSFHRYTRGVHDECCLKACTFQELTGYCSHPKPQPLGRYF